MDKIDLDAIFRDVSAKPLPNVNKVPQSYYKVMMKEAIHQALVLASEKAKTKQVRKKYEDTKGDYYYIADIVDKESILDIEKLIV